MLQQAKNKRGVSIMIGYILLIGVVIAISIFVYTWIKTYVPRDAQNCPDGTSISIKDVMCLGGEENGYTLNLTLKNNGRFNIAGYFILTTNSSSQELATIDISSKLKEGGEILGNTILFATSDENSMKSNDEKESTFDLNYKIYSIEITPVRFQEEANREKFVSCGDVKVKESVNCAEDDDGDDLSEEATYPEEGDNLSEEATYPEEGDSYTKLLLHLNGTDDSTTDADFVDSSVQGHTVTQEGGAKLEANQSKWGTSGYFDGSGDYLTIPDHTDWTFGSGDFTIDFWLRRSSTGGYMGIVNSGTSGGTNKWVFIGFVNDDTIKLIMKMDDETQVSIISTGTITDTNWHHIATVRDGNTMRLFIDGSADGTADVTGDTLKDSSEVLTIGRTGSYDGEYYSGYLDEIRISNIARWTTNFAVPSSEH